MLSVTNQASPLAGKMVEQTTTTGTINANVTGGAGILYFIDVDNTANSSPSWLKMWDNAAPTVGTTPADWVIKIPASVRRAEGIIQGIAFTNLSFCVVSAAAEATTTSPVSAVAVRLLTS